MMPAMIVEMQWQVRRRPNRRVGKDDALVAFSHGLDPTVRTSMRSGVGVKETRNAAEQANVRLIKGSTGGKFSKQDEVDEIAEERGDG